MNPILALIAEALGIVGKLVPDADTSRLQALNAEAERHILRIETNNATLMRSNQRLRAFIVANVDPRVSGPFLVGLPERDEAVRAPDTAAHADEERHVGDV